MLGVPSYFGRLSGVTKVVVALAALVILAAGLVGAGVVDVVVEGLGLVALPGAGA
jgi:hypothetical protein